ncbi:MAG: radical SAM protein, partial [Stackebrandtia sp.]
MRGCFGGHTLNFIEPDGSVWDCPSGLKIAATPPAAHRSVVGANAAELFGPPTGAPAVDRM